MRNIASLQPVFRILGVIGLFLALISQSNRFETPIIALKYLPYLVFVSLVFVCTGLYIKLKYAEEKPNTLTYIVTFITLLVALIICYLLLYNFFMVSV